MSTAAHPIQCVVVTPERTLFDETVDFVALPLYDGEVGIGPGRSPLIGRLGFGEMRTKIAGETHRYFVEGGFVQVRDNIVTVLTQRAIAAEKIELPAATSELDLAKALPSTTEVLQDVKAKAIARARAQVRVASKRS